MRQRSTMRLLFVVGVLVGSMALMGCPYKPEVIQAGPGAVGPAAAGAPGVAPAQPGPRAPETPVTRPGAPSEQPQPGAPSAAAPGAPGAAPSAAAPGAPGAPGAAPSAAAPGAPGAAPSAAAPGAPGAPGAAPSAAAPGAPGAAPSAAAPGAPGAPGAAPGAAAVPAASPLKDVFFDFDKFNIKDDQKAALNDNITYLKTNQRVRITLEGHCDERGTVEYNLGLGERRAKSTKDYLVAAGIAADRVNVISYGKERPFVLGHDESAWKWNRRSHFVITAQ
jgi:peptidoglycan-associated lipoprotein